MYTRVKKLLYFAGNALYNYDKAETDFSISFTRIQASAISKSFPVLIYISCGARGHAESDMSETSTSYKGEKQNETVL